MKNIHTGINLIAFSFFFFFYVIIRTVLDFYDSHDSFVNNSPRT